ncbi:MAG: histone deacetylase [Planctomycetota bacterium]
MARTAYYWDALTLEHDTGPHVECIARAERLAPGEMLSLIPRLDARPVLEHDAVHWITQVHSPQYHEFVKSACETGRRLLDEGDTVACRRSYDVAVAGVNAVLTAADALMQGHADNAFCAMRPPGHHALPTRAMGFCFFANVSILARFLQRVHGLEKIAIVDWDVHHGNGTQDIFYHDPSVMFVSLHQVPLWPGSGMENETGEGAGKGFTVNVPIAPGTPESEYLKTFDAVVVPRLTTYKPDAILISAGFDAHRDDPLGGLMLTEAGFAQMTQRLREIADRHCDGRLISCLEGGYNLPALQGSVAAHVNALGD